MIIILDTETTGLDPNEHRIIEFASAAFTPTWEPASGYSPVDSLVWDETVGAVPEHIEQITHISTSDCMARGISFPDAMALFDEQVDYFSPQMILAHNADYDRSMVVAECKRWNLPGAKVLSLPWVCSRNDFKYPANMRSKRLQHLALDHGIAVNPALQHRALADVFLLAGLCKAANMDPEALLKHALAPSILIRAIVKPPWEDNGASTTKAKANGFRWEDPGNGAKVPKSWVKLIKDFQLEDEKKNFPYQIGVV